MKGFSQTLDTFIDLALKLFGIGYIGVADKVVDSPVGEEIVHNFSRCHLIIRATPGFDKAGNCSIVGVYNERIELNFKFPVDTNRRPGHMSFSFKYTRSFVLNDSIKN